MGKKVKDFTAPSSAHCVTSVTLTGAEKRQKPNKHYVFVLEVEWSDNERNTVYRSYSDFYDFHITLMDMFPVAAGLMKTSDRVLPFLPGRRLFRRNEVERVAKKRLVSLAEYCADLMKLDEQITNTHLVVEFFTASESDINPPNDERDQASPSSKKKLKGSTLKLETDTDTGELHKPMRRRSSLPNLAIESDQESGSPKTKQAGSAKPSRKSESPLIARLKKIGRKGSKESSSSAEKEETSSENDFNISNPIEMEEYRAVADYEAVEKQEVSLKAGDSVDVIEKHDNGWWFCEVNNRHGWLPASYVEPIRQQIEPDEPEPCFDGNVKFVTTSDYEAQFHDEVSFPEGAVVDVLHKLLDGWWIICYDGIVGHAPAAYLQPYDNPLAKTTRITPTIRRKANKFRPIPRRHTIKNRESIWVNQSPMQRDMSVYRAKSKKMKKKMNSKTSYLQPVEAKQNADKQISYQNEELLEEPGPEMSDSRTVLFQKLQQRFNATEAPTTSSHPILTPIKNYQHIQDQDDIDPEDYEDIEEDEAYYLAMTTPPDSVPPSSARCDSPEELSDNEYVNVRRPGQREEDLSDDDWEVPPKLTPGASSVAPMLPPRAGLEQHINRPKMQPFIKLPGEERNTQRKDFLSTKLGQGPKSPTNDRSPPLKGKNVMSESTTNVRSDWRPKLPQIPITHSPKNSHVSPQTGDTPMPKSRNSPPFPNKVVAPMPKSRHSPPTKSKVVVGETTGKKSPAQPNNTIHKHAVNELKAKLARQLQKIDSDEGSPSSSPISGSPVTTRAAKDNQNAHSPLRPPNKSKNTPPKPPAKPKKPMNW